MLELCIPVAFYATCNFLIKLRLIIYNDFHFHFTILIEHHDFHWYCY